MKPLIEQRCLIDSRLGFDNLQRAVPASIGQVKPLLEPLHPATDEKSGRVVVANDVAINHKRETKLFKTSLN